jgi:hypothetical protein
MKQHKDERFTVMTAYQFAFYTFYQLFEATSLDKASVWKAGMVIGVVEAWIGIIILALLGLIGVAFQHPIPLIGGAGVMIPLLLYYAFDRNDRWKIYADQFRQYSPTKLLIGRVLVGVVVVSAFVAVLVIAKHVQMDVTR